MPLPGSYQIDFASRTRIVFGIGAIDELGRLVSEYGGRRVLLVTDPGIVCAGHAARAQSVLAQAGLTTCLFDRVEENPTTSVVERCAVLARREQIDFLVGLGGGSSMDTAKGCNFLVSNGGRVEDYWGHGKAFRPMTPMIAVPTTAGTGSECQSYALISQEGTHVKMACGDPKAAAKVAILDPALTLTQPPQVTAAAGIDALAHAVESAVTKRRNPLSLMLSREAFRLCAQGLRRVLVAPNDLDARGQVLLGAALAGMAIENSMLGAAHSAANPLTARYGVVHGQAVGLMLPEVVRYNGADAAAAAIYRELTALADMVPGDGNSGEPAKALAALLESYLVMAGLPRSLEELGIRDPDLGRLAEEAAAQWTAGFNPRPVGREDFRRMYEAVLHNA